MKRTHDTLVISDDDVDDMVQHQGTGSICTWEELLQHLGVVEIYQYLEPEDLRCMARTHKAAYDALCLRNTGQLYLPVAWQRRLVRAWQQPNHAIRSWGRPAFTRVMDQMLRSLAEVRFFAGLRGGYTHVTLDFKSRRSMVGGYDGHSQSGDVCKVNLRVPGTPAIATWCYTHLRDKYDNWHSGNPRLVKPAVHIDEVPTSQNMLDLRGAALKKHRATLQHNKASKTVPKDMRAEIKTHRDFIKQNAEVLRQRLRDDLRVTFSNRALSLGAKEISELAAELADHEEALRKLEREQAALIAAALKASTSE